MPAKEFISIIHNKSKNNFIAIFYIYFKLTSKFIKQIDEIIINIWCFINDVHIFLFNVQFYRFIEINLINNKFIFKIIDILIYKDIDMVLFISNFDIWHFIYHSSKLF